MFVYVFQHYSSVILAVEQYPCTMIVWLQYNLTGTKALQNTPHCYIGKRYKVTNQWIYQYGRWERYNYRGVISDNQFTNKLALAQY